MIREEDPRFRNLERKIGIFIATALAGIVIAAVLFGLQKDFFTPKYRLQFTTDSGTGFTKGMPVKLSGFRIGRVTAISLNKLAMVDVAIEIDSDYRTWIRSDSMARLVKEGLVGDSIIDVSAGSPDKPMLKDRDTITFIETKGLDEVAKEIAQKVKPVLMEIRDIISYINDPEGDLKRTIRNAELLTRNLESTRQHADGLIVTANDRVQAISDRTVRILDSIDLKPALARINNSLEQIDRKLPPLLEKADATMENVNRLSHETRLLSERAFPKVPGVLSQAEELMFSTDRLVNSLRNSWLLRDTPPPAGRQYLIGGDSHE